ncbi:MAG TPA: DNA repair protein RecO [Gammaproteobacteria bacterium]|nr:DNA repair protein RecO [Gammaproteobacteria bacterium]
MKTTERVTLLPAYVLHQYDWRETSRMIEAFSRDHGRVGLIARGSRRASSPWRAVLRPFQPLLLSWMGSGELATLTGAEAADVSSTLSGRALMSGFYMNELLLRLLPRQDPHPELFAQYMNALDKLMQATEPTLRMFEMNLLSALGYGLNLERDAITGQPLESDARYRYETEIGLVRIKDNVESGTGIRGSSLLAIASGNYQKLEQLSDARYLLRNIINNLLGEKPLKTRKIMRAFMRIHA